MSEAKIIITNVNDDESVTETRIYNAKEDMLVFENIHTHERRTNNLMTVSLFNDLLVEGEEKYRILLLRIMPTKNDQSE